MQPFHTGFAAQFPTVERGRAVADISHVPNLLEWEFCMLRFLAGAAVCFLLMSGAFLIWQSRAADRPGLPDALAARAYARRC